jgi:hypothetical protein
MYKYVHKDIINSKIPLIRLGVFAAPQFNVLMCVWKVAKLGPPPLPVDSYQVVIGRPRFGKVVGKVTQLQANMQRFNVNFRADQAPNLLSTK